MINRIVIKDQSIIDDVSKLAEQDSNNPTATAKWLLSKAIRAEKLERGMDLFLDGEE